MILEMGNQGAVGLANGWSVGGCTRHVTVHIHYIKELKEAGILVIKWVPRMLIPAENSCSGGIFPAGS